MITGLSGLRKTRRRWRGGNAVRCAVAILAPAACNAPAGAQLPCSYTVTVLPTFNGCFGGPPVPGTPVAINNLGHVLLTRTQCLEGYSDTYLWTGGPTLTLIPRPIGMLGFTGRDLNDNDIVCGEAWYASPTGLRAVVYNTNNGQWTILPPLNPPEGWSSAAAINNNNDVCGYRTIGSKDDPVNPQTAFRWSAAEGFTDLGLVNGIATAGYDINSNSQVAVGDSSLLGLIGLRWSPSQQSSIGPMPDGSSPYPRRINLQGVVAGTASLSPTSSQPFIWRDGVVTLLGRLPGFNNGGVGGINGHSVVTGLNSNSSNGLWHAYVWQAGILRDLNDLATDTSLLVRRSVAINDGGAILADASPGAIVMLIPQFSIAGDTDCNQSVTVNDLLNVINQWGPCPGCPSEITGDNLVGIADLLEVLLNWSH